MEEFRDVLVPKHLREHFAFLEWHPDPGRSACRMPKWMWDDQDITGFLVFYIFVMSNHPNRRVADLAAEMFQFHSYTYNTISWLEFRLRDDHTELVWRMGAEGSQRFKIIIRTDEMLQRFSNVLKVVYPDKDWMWPVNIHVGCESQQEKLCQLYDRCLKDMDPVPDIKLNYWLGWARDIAIEKLIEDGHLEEKCPFLWPEDKITYQNAHGTLW